MTQSYVRIGDREALVLVEPHGEGKYKVTVDEAIYEVERSGGGSSGGSLLIKGQQFEVFAHLAKSAGGSRSYALSVNGRQRTAAVTDPLSHLAQESDTGAGSARVDAYMPGRVVALLVEVGDVVEQGQGVLVLEAMKMENEIAAEAAGVVSQFFVEQGQAVEGGDALFEVAPSAEE